MNILVVHETDYCRKVVYDYQLLSEALAKIGHNIYVIDYQLNDNKTPKHEVVSRAIEGANVKLIHPPFIRVKGLNRITSFISHYYAIKNAIKEYKIDTILLYSVPTNGLQSLYLSAKFEIPVIFRSLDALNSLVSYPVLNRVTRELERVVYKNVDKILTITPKLSDYVISLGAYEKNVEYLPMTVDRKIFKPFKSTILEKWNVRPFDKVVLFMGTLFDFSGLDSFIYTFDKVASKVVNVKLVIVGDGEQLPRLQKIVKQKRLENYVVFTGRQPYKDMPAYINSADVCINPFQINDITKDIFPGKTVQYLACGKPVIMTHLEGVKAVIQGEEQGVLYTDIDKMYNVVVDILTDHDRRKVIGNNGLKYSENSDCLKVALQLEKIMINLKNETRNKISASASDYYKGRMELVACPMK
jgi:glycosyltransferase involved in cell wall biosynthesis